MHNGTPGELIFADPDDGMFSEIATVAVLYGASVAKSGEEGEVSRKKLSGLINRENWKSIPKAKSTRHGQINQQLHRTPTGGRSNSARPRSIATVGRIPGWQHTGPTIRQAHNLKVTNSNPVPRNHLDLRNPGPSGRGFRFEGNRQNPGEMALDVNPQNRRPRA